MSPNIVNRVFRYVPRNRIVTNTFKFRSEEKQVYVVPPQHMNIQQPSTANTYPSLTFSQEGESNNAFEQFPPLSGQFNPNIPPVAKTMNIIAQEPPRDASENQYEYFSFF